MSNTFNLLMLSAMYENGGNTTHRFLDGHPQMFVYPFESQVGTRMVADHLSSMYPVKYRWPEFALDATPDQDYAAIIDEECKVRARTPQVSKFRHVPFDFSDEERGRIYADYVKDSGRSRANNVSAFFRSTFDAWKDYKRTGEQTLFVGYSPIICIDADKILSDLPQAHMLHVVRNPWSAYADTKKRPMPLSLHHYMAGWTTNQYHALYFKAIFPDRLHVVRAEDVMADPRKALGDVCDRLGLERSDSLGRPTWNGIELEEVYPWGTLRKVSPAANRATAAELTRQEREAIRAYAWQYLDVFDYTNFIAP
ncbi:MAG TPA: sulfotransferase [Ktedonobacterales bacterium]|nr:sulfotransferase [Ktedonobacterales bacterium]